MEFIINNKKYLLAILYIFISFFIIAYLFYTKAKDELLSDWKQHRSNPLVMPFAGLLGMDAAANMYNIMWTAVKKFFSFFITI